MAAGTRWAVVLLGCNLWTACEFGDDLSAEQLSSVVQANKPALESCYQEALNRSPEQADLQLQVELKVAPTGEVAEVSLLKDARARPDFTDCIRSALAAMRFPEADIATHASLPLIFEPKPPPEEAEAAQ